MKGQTPSDFRKGKELKIITISLLGTSIIFLSTACAKSTPQSKIIQVDENNDKGTVELRVGDQIEISLPGNPTTGYSWTISTVDKTILEPLGEPEYKPKGDALGAGGRFTLRLKAIAAGETWVEMTYSQSFNKENVPPGNIYHILVKVIN